MEIQWAELNIKFAENAIMSWNEGTNCTTGQESDWQVIAKKLGK